MLNQVDLVELFVPDHVKERLELVSWGKAIQGIHNPKTIREITDARRRLAFEELFLFQLQVSDIAAPRFPARDVLAARSCESNERGRERRGTPCGALTRERKMWLGNPGRGCS
jgi:RecG-like helicase